MNESEWCKPNWNFWGKNKKISNSLTLSVAFNRRYEAPNITLAKSISKCSRSTWVNPEQKINKVPKKLLENTNFG